MTNTSKNKGDKAERELAGILADRLGINVRRKLGAGRADDTGDLDGLDGVTAQVKNYKDIARAINETVTDLPVQMVNAGTPLGVGFVRRPGGRWIAVMGVDEWCTWYREVCG